MEQEDRTDSGSGGGADPQDASLPSLSKIPRLDTGIVSQEAGMWSYVGKNKPVGIAQPLPKRESVDFEPVDDLCKGDVGCHKSEDKKLENMEDGGKSELGKDVSVTEDAGLKGTRTSDHKSKPSSSGVESDSGTDTTSTFEFPFEPPSDLPDSSDEGGDGAWQEGVAGRERAGEEELKDNTDCAHFPGRERTKPQKGM